MLHRDLVARFEVHSDGQSGALYCPAVGLWRPVLPEGALVRPGFRLGWLEILGTSLPVVTPPQATGIVRRTCGLGTACAFGDPLIELELRLEAGFGSSGTATDTQRSGTDGGLAFRSPLSGRFYARPSPDQPAFISTGETVRNGQTIGLLEVMKTFNRIVYGAPGLPESAVVRSIVPNDESDVEQGDPILLLDADKP